eukprot:scaffold3059_cov124-Pinguiococcus_pyrenoidosus.AAC.1
MSTPDRLQRGQSPLAPPSAASGASATRSSEVGLASVDPTLANIETPPGIRAMRSRGQLTDAEYLLAKSELKKRLFESAIAESVNSERPSARRRMEEAAAESGPTPPRESVPLQDRLLK